MVTVEEIGEILEGLAPRRLAEDWDNVGLLVGDARQAVERVMTCLTITPASAQEAIEQRAELIVTHHPLPFKPLRQLTADTTPGRLLLDLIRAGVAIYSPHTAFDSAAAGINQQLAAGLGLANLAPLLAADNNIVATEQLGSGRFGRFATAIKLSEVASRLKQFLKISGLHVVGDLDQPIETAAVACGSGGSLLEPAIRAGCQLLITGEAGFHTCLEAEANGIALLLPGHYASERFGVENLATILATQFPALTVWPSRQEADPLRWQ